ncbi:MAG TPA: rhodanese-like domain-containing protein [Syntrophales bacterium]|nr:rhodanese-like domain-containing protein [Syntrophales bacterium]HOL59572.1 rhodanese-like domain-containing protein [Syntrophales bacterium]HPO35662.1 rhodanese-like domain-containing protein [Syntrophales bacterium]
MKKLVFFSVFLLAFMMVIPLAVSARGIDPIVTTEWLENNMFSPNLVILDVRKGDAFAAGHIPNASNVAYGAWAVNRKVLHNELPAPYDLPDLIGLAGINKDSKVVVVSSWDTDFEKMDAFRVAWTLLYSGIQEVAVLEGGYTKWVKEKRPISTAVEEKAGPPYKGQMNPNLFIKKQDVMNKLNTALILDVRVPRIKNAKNVYYKAIFKDDLTYKPKEELEKIVTPIVGTDKAKEIIVYCDTGKFATSWAYVLTELLGYTNVKVYDGSFEEWALDPNAPVE